MLDENLQNRLKKVIDSLGMDKSVQISGKSAKQLSRYIKGSEPPVGVVSSLASASGASVSWLIDGRTKTIADTDFRQHILEEELAELRHDMDNSIQSVEELKNAKELEVGILKLLEYNRKAGDAMRSIGKDVSTKFHSPYNNHVISIPRFDAHLSAGNGNWHEDCVALLDHIPFTLEFLEKKLGRKSANDLLVLEANGDSMLPTISDGDLVLVDKRALAKNDGIFAYVQDGLARVKRFRFLSGGKVEIVSDNRDIYSPEILSNADAEELTIIGRVRWIGHTV